MSRHSQAHNNKYTLSSVIISRKVCHYVLHVGGTVCSATWAKIYFYYTTFICYNAHVFISIHLFNVRMRSALSIRSILSMCTIITTNGLQRVYNPQQRRKLFQLQLWSAVIIVNSIKAINKSCNDAKNTVGTNACFALTSSGLGVLVLHIQSEVLNLSSYDRL